jgi:hypothetical protein
MNNKEWKIFLSICRETLGKGAWDSFHSESWCAYTTFSSLENGIYYWNCGFPDQNYFGDTHILDGGLWRQSFKYSDLAHIIIPKTFYWEIISENRFESGTKIQDLNMLSKRLIESNILHRKTDLILEIKLY